MPSTSATTSTVDLVTTKYPSGLPAAWPAETTADGVTAFRLRRTAHHELIGSMAPVQRAAFERIVRAVRIDGRSLPVTADYAAHRIDVATQDGIIVDVVSPRVSAEEAHD